MYQEDSCIERVKKKSDIFLGNYSDYNNRNKLGDVKK